MEHEPFFKTPFLIEIGNPSSQENLAMTSAYKCANAVRTDSGGGGRASRGKPHGGSTIHLRRPWTSAFFRFASGTVGFSPRLKNSGHVITYLRRCGLQNTDHVMLLCPLKVDSLSHVFPAFVKVQEGGKIRQRRENGTGCPLLAAKMASRDQCFASRSVAKMLSHDQNFSTAD